MRFSALVTLCASGMFAAATASSMDSTIFKCEGTAIYECPENGGAECTELRDCYPQKCVEEIEGAACEDNVNATARAFARRAGSECDDGAYECAEGGASVNQCQNGRWVDVADCEEPDKCIIDAQGDYCGLPGSPNARTFARGEIQCFDGAYECAEGGASVLKCVKGQWVDDADCEEPDKCIIDAQGGYCGLPPGSPNARMLARGDIQCFDGAYECAEGGASVLKCINGEWIDNADCEEPNTCIIDAQGGHCSLPRSNCGVSSRFHARRFGRATMDECLKGNWKCSADGMEVMQCYGGRWSQAMICTGEQRCVIDTTGGNCCNPEAVPSAS